MSSKSRTKQLKKILNILQIAQKISSMDSSIISDKISDYFKILLVSFFVIIMPFIMVYRLLDEPIYTRDGTILRGAQLLSYTTRVPTFVVCLLASLYHRGTLKMILQEVEAIDDRFEMFGQNIKYGNLLRMSYIKTIRIFCEIFFVNVSYVGSNGSGKHPVVDWLIYSIPIFQILILTMQWVILHNIQLIQIATLRKLSKTLEWNPFWLASDITKLQPYRKETNDQLQSQTISEMAKIYDRLYSQNEKLMKSFGLQILCILTLIFISSTYTSFKLVRIVSGKENMDVRTLVYHILYVLIYGDILMPCIRIQKEARLFVEWLFEMSVKFLGTPQDKVIKNLLLQIRHQEMRCSVLGLFILNGSFLTNSLSANLTNLIILVQSEDEGKLLQ